MTMTTEDMIKYGAIAVGAYLLYQWLTQPGGLLAPSIPVAALPPGTDPGFPKTGGKDPVPSTLIGANTPTPEQIWKAALNNADAGLSGGWRQSFHQWNFYRMQAARQAGWTEQDINDKTQADLSSVLDPTLAFTAAEYHAALNTKGLEGFGNAPAWGNGMSYGFQ